MTVRGEPSERLLRRFSEVERLCADGLVDELVVAAPPAEVDAVVQLGVEAPQLNLIVVPNATGERSKGLNAALQRATCELVMRLDARSSVGAAEVRELVGELVRRPDAGVVGAHQIPVTVERGWRTSSIVRALSNPAALGNAPYRRSGTSGPVDTVYLGVFRRAELLAMGGWDEHLFANEDFDLCRRIAERDRLVWLAEVDLHYEPRSELGAVWRQYHSFGASKVRYWRHRRAAPSTRQQLAVFGTAFGATVGVVALTHVRYRQVAVAGVVLLLSGVDCLHPRKDPLHVRLGSLPVYVAVWGGWLSGIAKGLVFG